MRVYRLQLTLNEITVRAKIQTLSRVLPLGPFGRIAIAQKACLRVCWSEFEWHKGQGLVLMVHKAILRSWSLLSGEIALSSSPLLWSINSDGLEVNLVAEE